MIIKIECIKQIGGFLIALGEPVEVKAIFNKLQYRRKFERFVLDVAGSCPGRDDQQRYARSESEIVDSRRRHMIVEAAKVVPRQEDYRRFPVRPLHDSIDLLHRPVFANAHTSRRMLTPAGAYDQPTYGRQTAVLGVGQKVSGRHYVLRPELGEPDMRDSVQGGPYIPRLILTRSIVLPA